MYNFLHGCHIRVKFIYLQIVKGKKNPKNKKDVSRIKKIAFVNTYCLVFA